MRHSRKGSSCVVCGLPPASSPLKASHRSIDLTRSHTLRRPSVRPSVTDLTCSSMACSYVSRCISGGALSQRWQRNTLSCVCVGGEEIAVWMAGCVREGERASGHLMAIAFLRRRAPCLEPPNRDRVRLHVGVRRPVVPPPARDRRTDAPKSERTGKEATGQRWRRVLGRLKWPLMAARPSPSLAPTSTPTSFRSRADDRCRQRAGERRRRRGGQWATAARRPDRR